MTDKMLKWNVRIGTVTDKVLKRNVRIGTVTDKMLKRNVRPCTNTDKNIKINVRHDTVTDIFVFLTGICNYMKKKHTPTILIIAPKTSRKVTF